MSPFVSGSMVFLVALIALVDPEPLRRIQVVHTEVSPGVTYRIERHWRLAQADAEEQSEWALTDFQNSREFRPIARRGEWWITKKIRELRWTAATAWDDHYLKGQLDRFYRNLPSNWHLCDLGISRNGKTLPLTAELAAAIWRDHSRFDAERRAWDDLYAEALTDSTPVLSDGYSVTELREHYIEQVRVANLHAEGANGFFMVSNDGIESVHVYPYVLFVRDGTLIGVIGGDGRFDRLPDEWEHLR